MSEKTVKSSLITGFALTYAILDVGQIARSFTVRKWCVSPPTKYGSVAAPRKAWVR